jgi:DNA-binding NarL/FixJ family response regulator
MKMAVSVLIIDDHPLMLDAVRMTMESIAPGSRIDTAATFGEARRLLAGDNNWDFALLDLNLPDCEGFDGLTALRELRPSLPTVVLSAKLERETILRCIDLGASGYIPKTYSSDAITHALRLVASGHIYVPREALGREACGEGTETRGERAQHAFERQALGAREPILVHDWRQDPHRLGMTERQCDVLRLILRGLPNKLICRQLDLAEGTVKVHVSAVLRALGVRTRTQAVIAASRLGLGMND